MVRCIIAALLLNSTIVGRAPAQPAKPPPSARPPLTEKQKKLHVQSFDYIWTTIRDKYFDPKLGGLNWQEIRKELRPKVEQAKTVNQVRAVMNDLVSRLGVSHFAIIPADAYQQLQPDKKPRDGTLGIDIRIVQGRALVTAVDDGATADEAGVQVGWEIARIGDTDVPARLASLNDELKKHPHRRTIVGSAVSGRLRGRVGDKQSLVFTDRTDKTVRKEIPFGKPKGKRAKFGNIPAFHVWIEVRKLESNIGYIHFNAFMHPVYVMGKFNQAMRDFRQADGIIIDVRGNGGGMGEMGMGMIGWLVGQQQPHLGTIIFRNNQLKMLVNPRPQPFKGPVAVLIDEQSVSAAEFFAGGIKDLGRARLFGIRTAGAALGSSIERLPNGDGFQYAVVNYVSRKTNQPLEGIGVTPHVEVKHTRPALRQGRDLQLEAAIQWIRQHDKD